MRITLITVCHKSRHKIANYVQSFLEHHQSEHHKSQYQFVFVENSGDTDLVQTITPLTDAGFEVVLLNTPNEGFGKGCNAGAKKANGDLLIFANPDIKFLCNLDGLLKQSRPLKWGTVHQLTPKGSIYSIDLLPEYKGIFFETLQLYRLINRTPHFFLCQSYVVGSFMIVSQNLFAESGGFDPTFFLYHEEAELARRLQTISGPPTICKSITVYHEGFGSHVSHKEVLLHETNGFLTYCKVTHQPDLIRKRLRTLRILGIFSPESKLRHEILLQASIKKLDKLL